MKKAGVLALVVLVFCVFFEGGFSQDASFGDSGGMIIQVKENLIENLSGDFSATFQGTPVKDVFRIFALQSGLNIMVSPNIKDNITANFTKVSIKDAFLAILSANNLYYLVQGNIVKILTPREYRNELLRQYVVSKTYDASIMDIKNLATVLKPLLSPGVGNFSIDSQSSKVIVTDIKDNFDRIDKLLSDISSLPKVVEIETRIVQIDLENNNEMGVNWSALNLGGAVDLKFIFAPSGGVATEALNIVGKQTFNNVGVDALISAIATRYKTKLLSQPRVLAVNRQEANIHIGSKVPYIKSILNNSLTGQQTSQVEFVDVGIKLIVTPMITPEDDVKIAIKAEMSSYQFVAITSTENAPKIITTELSCDSIAKDGQTIIIGGLIKNEKTTQKKAVPFLGEIPVLDLIFSHNIDTYVRSELVIFITPRVIKTGKSNVSLQTTSKEAIEEGGATNQLIEK
jgi:type II secretory pathway component GspD/PulD (secretin)